MTTSLDLFAPVSVPRPMPPSASASTGPAASIFGAAVHGAAGPRASTRHHKQAAAADLLAVLRDIFLDEEPAQGLLAVAGLVPTAHQAAWHLLTHTLLARRLELGSPTHLRRAAGAHTLAWAWARQWEQPQVLQRWHRLVDALTARQCSQLAARASQHLRHLAAIH
ncbi:MAG: hypothetical protein ACKOJ7_11565 [Betaproteobacteria bacterium]